MLDQITGGRTDSVFDYIAAGNKATDADRGGVSLLQWCAYYGDVSAIRFLMMHGATLEALGDNLDLNGASFHGHWRLCQFLVENGADVNAPLAETGETPLHASLCTRDRTAHNPVMRVLLAKGANPNSVTRPSVETGGFMRDCRTKGETPLHRAAAFGDEEAIGMLLDAGAKIDAKDMNGDSPLSWASWYLRPDPILRLLLRQLSDPSSPKRDAGLSDRRAIALIEKARVVGQAVNQSECRTVVQLFLMSGP